MWEDLAALLKFDLMDQSLFLILCLSWIILPVFSPSELHLSIKDNVPPPFLSFIFCHFLSWEDLEEIVLSIHPLSISSVLAAVASISESHYVLSWLTSFSRILFISLFFLFPSIRFPSVYFFVPVISLSLPCSVLSLLPSVFCPLLSTALFLSTVLYFIICYLLFSSPLFSLEPAFLVTFSFATSHLVYFLPHPLVFLSFPSFSPHLSHSLSFHFLYFTPPPPSPCLPSPLPFSLIHLSLSPGPPPSLYLTLSLCPSGVTSDWF